MAIRYEVTQLKREALTNVGKYTDVDETRVSLQDSVYRINKLPALEKAQAFR